MSFSRKITLLFGAVMTLLATLAVTTFSVLKEINISKSEWLDRRMYVATEILNAVNEAKSIEAACAHFTIRGDDRSYNELKEAYAQLKKDPAALLNDPRFSNYHDELKTVVALEATAEIAGEGVHNRRLRHQLTAEQAGDLLDRGEFPIISEIERRLGFMQTRAMNLWVEAYSSVKGLQIAMSKLMRYALAAVAILVLLLIFAISAIVRQQTLLEEEKRKDFEREQNLSAARKEIVEVVAHDLRSPLGAVKMSLELVDSAPVDKREEFMQVADRNLTNAIKLIEQLLDHAKIESNTMVLDKNRCDMTDFFNEQKIVFSALCEKKNISFVVEMPHSPGSVLCDRIRIHQALSNLIGNSLKFSSPGTKILLCVIRQGCELVIETRDQGPGIAEDDIAHIFDRYWQKPANRRLGAGLGLFIAKSIVEAHGGRIWVKSEKGRGTSFFIALPA